MKIAVSGNAEGLSIVGEPALHKRLSVSCKGTGNRLVIEDGVRLINTSITFFGDSGTLHIGRGSKIQGTFILVSDTEIRIGEKTKMNAMDARIHCGEPGTSITFGQRCLLSNVRVRTSDQHSIIDLATGERINWAADVVVEDRVWIAEDVYIYKGVRIGTGSIVGARSTVTKDLPPHALCLGTPAKAVRHGVGWNEKFLPRPPAAPSPDE